jgi:hemerythrin
MRTEEDSSSSDCADIITVLHAAGESSMTLVQWEENFALGIADVDHEHRALIDLINRLHAALGGAAGKGDIADFLADLHASVAAHFALEESVMRQCNYDQLMLHKADH